MTNNTFDKSIISKPEIFKQNKLEPIAEYRYCRNNGDISKTLNMVGIQEDDSILQSLNGTWKVYVSKNPDGVPDDFYKIDFDEKDFKDIKVPAHIQTEGFDNNAYVNYQYPWDGVEDIKPGQIPTEYNPVACYILHFDMKLYNDTKTYRISFDGVESNMALFLNGKYVGYAEDAFTTSEFDITELIKEKDNKLAVMVYKWCSSCFVDDQDFFRFSGIFRDVKIKVDDPCHIKDIRVSTDIYNDYECGKVNVKFNLFDKNHQCSYVKCWMYDSDANVHYKDVLPSESGACLVTEAGDETSFIGEALAKGVDGEELNISIDAGKVNMWSAEKPALYTLYLAPVMIHDDGTSWPLGTYAVRFGFRKFEMLDGIMCLNGKRIVFNGVNRHEFSMKTGRVISYEETKQDIINMKKNNINALRTSHYPNNEFVYDLCDEYGLYVICETNMESHGSWNNIYAGMTTKEEVVPGDNPDFKELIIDRANAMIKKEINHPSILIWSCGNESFGGSNIWEMSNHMRKLDPTRLIHYEGIFHDRRYPDTSDMESQMYPSVENIKKFLSENKEKPFICCEYTHAMGNSCGGMFKYTDLTKTEPRYQGGFIWDYIDQALETENVHGEKYLGYGGDFGDRPCDYEFSGDGICYADRTDSPKMQSVKYNYQPVDFEVEEVYPTDGSAKLHDSDVYIYVTNLNLFTSFSEYDIDVEFHVNGEKIEDTEGRYYISDKVRNLEPGDKGCIEIDMDLPLTTNEKYHVCTATVIFKYKKATNYANASDVVAVYQYKKVFENENYISEYTADELSSFRIIEGGYNVGVKGKRFSCLFSAIAGGMTSYVYDGKEYIDILPRPNFWRAPTDNDRGNYMPFRYAQWKSASLYQMFKDPADSAKNPIEVVRGENSYTIKYTYYLPTTPSSVVIVGYTVFPDGRVTVNMNYDMPIEIKDLPEFGMLINLPLELENVSWLGLGPEETYADKTQGALFSKYSNKVADNFARYLRPQECGNKMSVYKASVTNNEGKGIEFSGKELNFSALPYTPDEIENARHAYELKRPDHTVVRVSLAQMGVGGDDTWGALTHPEFLVREFAEYGTLEFEFSFKGI